MAKSKKKLTTAGNCELCGKSFLKASMGRHLKACRKAHPVAPKKKSAKPEAAYLLSIEGRDYYGYWLFVEMPTSATLEDLDWFLRDIWLECCGHLSEFRVGETAYFSGSDCVFDDGFDEGDEPMDIDLADALKVGDKADYTYDFGTSTRLTIKVVGEHESAFDPREPVRLLARNDAPRQFRCGCGESGVVLDAFEHEVYCLACYDKAVRSDEEIQPLPLLNSPRVGECAYGEDELDDFLKAARKQQAMAKKRAAESKPVETA